MAYSKALAYATFVSVESVQLMVMRLLLPIAALGIAAVSIPAADARPRDREQDAAYRATQEGRFIPLRTIESRIVPRMEGAKYLGPELDAVSGRYRLKFERKLRDSTQIMWVDVDARSGDIIGKSGF